MFHDLRCAVRALRRAPLFTLISILTLGIGIGIVTALFAVVDAVLLRPVADDQDRIVRMWMRDVQRDGERLPVAYPEFLALRERSRSFERLAAIMYADLGTAAIAFDGRPSAVRLAPVSAEFFEVLFRGRPLHGRWLDASDEADGAELAAVVSEAFWRRISGADPALVGRHLTWAGSTRTVRVVGIAPAALNLPIGADMWIPIRRYYCPDCPGGFDVESRSFAQFELLGRLADGVSRDEARRELAVVHQRLVELFPDDYESRPWVVEPLLDTVVGSSRQALLFLLVAGGLVFVISGVNVAALLLMRAFSARSDLAIRVALGAGAGRLARQVLTESVLLGVFGAVCGALMAKWLLGAVQWAAPADIPRIERAALDPRVLAVSVVAALGWVMALGTAPLWNRRKFELAPGVGLRETSVRGPRGGSGLRLFTAIQIAAALVIAAGAGLLVRSFVHLQGIERGFDTAKVAVVSFLLPEHAYADQRARQRFFEDLAQRVTSIPGVVSASPVHMAPGSGIVGLSAPMMFEGQTEEEAARNPWATWEPVLPSYFTTLGIAIVTGRPFTDADSRNAAPVAIVSEAMARRYWPGQSAVGRRVRLGRDFDWATVVGVARDARYRDLTNPWLTAYFPADQFFFFAPTLLAVRTNGDPAALLPAVRERIQAQEPNAAVEWSATMDALVGRQLSRARTALTVAALFALAAVALAAIGVFGVTSYEVTRRERELAVRSALGATPRRLLRDVIWRATSTGAAGIAGGLAAAVMLTRILRAVLYEVSPHDPWTLAAAGTTLLGIVLLAACAPAIRASRVDPVALLRSE